MIQFSTILYFNELPVGYDVCKEPSGFYFRPVIDTGSEESPMIMARLQDGKWLIEGTCDSELQQQVANVIVINALVQSSGPLRAAS